MRRTIACLALAVSAASARGQDATRPSSVVRVEVDNDFLALRGGGAPPDNDYTHGTRISVVRPRASAWIARAVGAAPHCTDVETRKHACLLSGVAIGQEIYTPRHNEPDHISGDRPHAAWLYGAIAIQRLTANDLHHLEIRAGVTGPPALGEPVQNGVHRLLHNALETGWAHQLPTQFGVTADYDATRVIGHHSSNAPSRFLAGSVGATIGTLRREARAGVSAYYGMGRGSDWNSAMPLVAKPGRFYVVTGYQQSIVQYDELVEGGRSTPGAARIPWVNEMYAGGGWQSHRLAVEYRHLSRGREYITAPGRHAYGAVLLSMSAR